LSAQRVRLTFAFLIAAALAGGGGTAPAAVRPECVHVPALTGRVVDKANLLMPATEARITAELAGLERRTSDQLVVVTLPSLDGRPIEEVGLNLGRCWGVGQKGLDNGVLLIVARTDRKVRIEVGTGLENLLKDDVAGQVIRETLVPAFREGRFDDGVEAGVARIEAVLLSDTRRPQRLPPPARS
jgi:uncharacterized protein